MVIYLNYTPRTDDVAESFKLYIYYGFFKAHLVSFITINQEEFLNNTEIANYIMGLNYLSAKELLTD